MTNQEAIEIITNAVQTENMTIEHDKALAIVQEALEKLEQEKKINASLRTRLKTAQATIHQLREGVRIGKWISHEDELGVTFECSVCHMETCSETPFCPHCGAETGKEDKI